MKNTLAFMHVFQQRLLSASALLAICCRIHESLGCAALALL